MSEAIAAPVWSWMTACGWAGVSVCKPRKKQKSSLCLATLRIELREPGSRLAMLREFELRADERAAAGADFAIDLLKLRLVFEGIELRNGAIHVAGK